MNENWSPTGSEDGTFVPFTDVLFNVLMGFAFMVFVAVALIRPDAKKNAISLRAEVLIDAIWPDNNPDDVDLYVRDPAGNIAWYMRREAGLLNLDRDDRGQYRDTMVIDGKRVANPINQETVSIRGIVPGIYTVNVVDYQSQTKAPVPVTVTVTKLNPEAREVFRGTLELAQSDERTAVQFRMAADGAITDVTTTGSLSLVRESKQPARG